MTSIDVRTVTGGTAGTAELADDVFGIEPNVALMHQVVTAQLAAARAGTHSTLTRAEVSGGGAKPWRQKGTGRARQGSIRAPHWRGGGVAHGPKPRNYRQRTPKKMVRLALRCALSDRALEGHVIVVQDWGIETPRTKEALRVLEALGLRTAGAREDRVLLVLDRAEEAVWKSFRNLGHRVQIVLPEELNTYDVLVSDWLVFSTGTLETTTARLSAGAATADAADDIEPGDDAADVEPADDTAVDAAGDTPDDASDSEVSA